MIHVSRWPTDLKIMVLSDYYTRERQKLSLCDESSSRKVLCSVDAAVAGQFSSCAQVRLPTVQINVEAIFASRLLRRRSRMHSIHFDPTKSSFRERERRRRVRSAALFSILVTLQNLPVCQPHDRYFLELKCHLQGYLCSIVH